MYGIIRRKDLPYILITIIIGIFAHFMYEYSGKNPITALIAPVNESVWEHLKLLFFPFLLSTLAEYYLRQPEPASFFTARFIGVWSGIFSIVFLYYGYSGILGKIIAPIDILLFLIGVVLTYYISFKLGRKIRPLEPLTIFLCWIVSILLFFIFTCFPPELPLFSPPL